VPIRCHQVVYSWASCDRVPSGCACTPEAVTYTNFAPFPFRLSGQGSQGCHARAERVVDAWVSPGLEVQDGQIPNSFVLGMSRQRQMSVIGAPR